jgi:c-di-GMP-binding flagellar brake protein YcgR
MSSKEHRRSPRRKVAEAVLVSDVMTEDIVGRIGNLSKGGMLLMASSPLNEDALYQFRFRLPGIDGADIEVGAHLLWVDRASSPGQSWAGFRFISLSDAHRERLHGWVDAPGSHYD